MTLDINGTYRFVITQIFGATLAITARAAAESPQRGYCGTDAIQTLGVDVNILLMLNLIHVLQIVLKLC